MAMNEALKRHEQSLHKVKELRKAQEDDFRHQINMESDIIKLETEQANYKKTKLNEDLQEQMRQNEIRRKFDKDESKQLVSTNGGPALPDRMDIIQKYKSKQAITKLDLERQMQIQENETKQKKEIEVNQEKIDAEMIAAKHLEDRKAQMKAMKDQRAHFAEIWNAQRAIKQQNEGIENAF